MSFSYGVHTLVLLNPTPSYQMLPLGRGKKMLIVEMTKVYLGPTLIFLNALFITVYRTMIVSLVALNVAWCFVLTLR